MTGEETFEETAGDDGETATRRTGIGHLLYRIIRAIAYLIAGLIVLLLAIIVFLQTPPGKRFIIHEIESFSPSSGLSIQVGSIDGSVLWSATFHDVKLRDANHKLFLQIPSVDLNWRPYKWFFSGLDVRHLVLSNGTLFAFPHLKSSNSNAPILPNFNIRVDRLMIDHLTVEKGLLGTKRVIDFRTSADVRRGKVAIDASGHFGGGDQFKALVHAQPARNIFALDVDWHAPKGGFLAGMVGARQTLTVSVNGKGTWQSWNGKVLAVQGNTRLLDFRLANRSGKYTLVGDVRPDGYLSGTPKRVVGKDVRVNASGNLQHSVLAGNFTMHGSALAIDGKGAIDLGNNSFDRLELSGRLPGPMPLGKSVKLRRTSFDVTLNGPFHDIAMPFKLRVDQLDLGGTKISRITQQGTATYRGKQVTIPLDATIGRVVTGNKLIDHRLVRGHVRGSVVYAASHLTANPLAVHFNGLDARLALDGNLKKGRYRIAGPVMVNGFAYKGLGTIDSRAQVHFAFGGTAPWSGSAKISGQVPKIANSTMASLAGKNVRFAGKVALGSGKPVKLDAFSLTGSNLNLVFSGSIAKGNTSFTGKGTQARYGPFTVSADITGKGPRGELVLANPLPALKLSQVDVKLAPAASGYSVTATGGSMLGKFDGLIAIATPAAGPTTIGVKHFDIAHTRLAGDLQLAKGGAQGTLKASGGGVTGRIDLAPASGAQQLKVSLKARNAQFGKLSIGRATIDANSAFGSGSSSVEANARIEGLNYGSIFIGRLATKAKLANGKGTFDAAIGGRRGSQFELYLNGAIAPGRISLAAKGAYSGKDITMPRDAVLSRTSDGGWKLAPTQLGYGKGFAVINGRFGGKQPDEGHIAMAKLPLSLIDAVAGNAGLDGSMSGLIDFHGGTNGLPVGKARIKIEGLTRSGVLLTSRPLDVALVADLSPALLQARAALSDKSGSLGTMDAQIDKLPQSGALTARLYHGNLSAQLRYQGPAAALWRLAAVDLVDFTGPLHLDAMVHGTLGDPEVTGSLSGDKLRVQSALTGTDLHDVKARGSFSGSRLQITTFAGTGPDGGSVSGSGFVDLAHMTRSHGPQLDLRMAANKAKILSLPNMSATVTGPMRLVSSGVGGTIAGRLKVDKAHWRLGAAQAATQLPDVQIKEINMPADIAPPAKQGKPWRYLIDASASTGIKVDGLGLDSEWSADIKLRGTTAAPRIAGQANIIPHQGFYSFAGVRFDITRGRISFYDSSPPNPRIDLDATTTVNSSLTVNVSVKGLASQPNIVFTSTPALPQEQILAKLLFGGSISNLSATDAVQLGAALASLRGGTGVGPINRLRKAIGLDRLRIVAADPALNRGTSVALGKNVTRRLYVELITDGAGYNATDLEYRITDWLSLLATVSSAGRQSGSAEISKDY